MKLPCLVLLATAVLLRADDESPLWQSRHVVEVFTLPEADAFDLIRQNLPGPALHVRALEALKSGTATLDKLIALTGRDEQRVEVQQIDQYPYPTEFDPPQVPQLLAIADPGPRKGAPPPDPAPSAPAHRSPFNGGLGIVSTTTPTAFEMIPLGDRFEIETTVQEHNRVSCLSALTTTELVCVETAGDVPLPVFAQRKRLQRIGIRAGEPAFLGTYNAGPNAARATVQAPKLCSLAFLTPQRETIPKGRGDDSDKTAFKHEALRLTIDVISTSKPLAHALLLQKLDGNALHEQLSDLVEKNSAVRELVMAQRSKTGQRLDLHSADELRFPTEFDPPQLPQQMILADHDLIEDLRAGRQTGLGAPPPVLGKMTDGGFGLITTTSPTAFEMQPLGARLELDPVIARDTFYATFALELTRLTGTVNYGGIEHPVFGVQKIVTSIAGRIGGTVFLGTLSRAAGNGFAASSKDDRIGFAFLRVSAIK